MSYAVMPMNDWQNVVNNVRAKTGKSEALVSGQVANEINNIPVGSDENTLNQYLLGTKTEITAEDLAEVAKIKNYAFYSSPITSVEIPDSVTSIGDYAFQSCSNLPSITIPDSVTSIGSFAFARCSKIETIVIPDSVVNLKNEAFKFCSGLKNATIGSGVQAISAEVFYQCTALERVNISYGVTYIASKAFYGCASLMEVICLAETPPTLHSSAFDGVPADCIFKVLPTSLEAYKAETNWSVRADNIIALTDEEVAEYGG